MLFTIGLIYIGYQLIKAIFDDAYIREKHREAGFGIYRSVDGKLHKTSSGQKLTKDEILAYYRGNLK